MEFSKQNDESIVDPFDVIDHQFLPLADVRF